MVTIRGNTIRGFQIGISVPAGSDAIIDSNDIEAAIGIQERDPTTFLGKLGIPGDIRGDQLRALLADLISNPRRKEREQRQVTERFAIAAGLAKGTAAFTGFVANVMKIASDPHVQTVIDRLK